MIVKASDGNESGLEATSDEFIRMYTLASTTLVALSSEMPRSAGRLITS